MGIIRRTSLAFDASNAATLLHVHARREVAARSLACQADGQTTKIVGIKDMYEHNPQYEYNLIQCTFQIYIPMPAIANIHVRVFILGSGHPFQQSGLATGLTFIKIHGKKTVATNHGCTFVCFLQGQN